MARDKSKNKHVAWFVSSCRVPSEREKYVRELQKYVNVDVYGQCGNKTCPKSFECLQLLTQKYFFYLSFESALCKVGVCVCVCVCSSVYLCVSID